MPQDLHTLPAAWQRQAQFCWMHQSFTRHGGLMRRKRPLGAPPDALLPLAFHWQDSWWTPGFQFEDSRRRVRQELSSLYTELPAGYRAWDIACWLALPHAALGGHPPVMLLPSYLETVCDAARIERYLVHG